MKWTTSGRCLSDDSHLDDALGLYFCFYLCSDLYFAASHFDALDLTITRGPHRRERRP